jgi:NAD(P)-dependent dehydrogenase (short-subunit alcohol dehydrogenase family)
VAAVEVAEAAVAARVAGVAPVRVADLARERHREGGSNEGSAHGAIVAGRSPSMAPWYGLERNMAGLAGRGALVVGARRIGATVVERLIGAGMRVAVGYRSERPATPPGAVAIHGTLEAAEQLVAEARAAVGDLYAVVNLASTFRRVPLADLDGAAWDRALADARGAYLLTLAAARSLRGNPGPTRGHILHFGDWAAQATPYRDYLPYLTAKAAVHFLTRAFAVELAAEGILVNGIAPGPSARPPEIDADEWRRDVLARTPLGRESAPDDIADLVAALLANQSVTGEIVRVDAGRHLAGPGWGAGS